MPLFYAFLTSHEALFAILGFLALSALIHVPAVRTRFPRLVAFVQAALPGDSPKMLAAATDALPPTDKAIVQALEAVANGAPVVDAKASLATPSSAAKLAAKVSTTFSLAMCGVMLLGGMFVGCVTGCTKAQGDQAKTVETVVEVVLKDGQKICVEARVLMGESEPAGIALACGIESAAEKALEAVIAEQQSAVGEMVKLSLAKPGSKPAVCR